MDKSYISQLGYWIIAFRYNWTSAILKRTILKNLC